MKQQLMWIHSKFLAIIFYLHGLVNSFCFTFRTDALIQQTIRNKFKECTVLTVAHRLHTVMDSDRILVMEAGIAMEFDIPYILLQNSNGIFKNMVDATGGDADALKKVAQDTYKQIMAKSEVL